MFDFTDQVAIVTGAAGNLGSAVARAFQNAGARLVLIDRRQELIQEAFPELLDNPDGIISAVADLTRLEDMNAVVTKTIERFSRVDILANTVGGFRSGTPVHETPLDTLDFMFNLNARVAFITSKAVTPQMLKQGSGKITHIAARPGLEGTANMAAYSAAKAAVIRITESAADELRHKGINVNCLLPGTIDTPENREAMPDAEYDTWVQPESLANVILFLSSPAAKDVHGAAIPVIGLT
jgi:NAD(P)-dependent dehydrogenase (short-subunit alcohol dehydrogenase family)